jgi:FkbM family methyltransferase
MNKIKRTFGFLLNHPLGKRHPVITISRFIIWQLQTLFSPEKMIVKTFVGPVKFYARKGLTGITGNIYSGLHEFDDMAFLLHFLREDDGFFDIGANVGSYTLLASGVSGANSISIEPVASTFDILSKNIELNQLTNKVSLINAVAGGEKSTIVFTQTEDTGNHVVAADEQLKDSAELPVITIDSLLNQHIPVLIKMDVEGYETEVLKGMTQTLSNRALKAIIIELNGSGGRYGFDERNIHDLLISNNFKPYNYNAFKRQLNPLERYGSYNTIYCRDLSFVNERVKTAAPVKIMGEKI